MTEQFRIGAGPGGKPVRFRFDGQSYTGMEGDTLASALLANGRRLVGRSFKYHRPRGILTAGPEEPNALVELRTGAFREPNTRATTIELHDGLEASSQNHRGSLEFDLLAVNDFLSPFLTAGFYYKTFMWPKSFWEKLYEPLIRSAAGLGRLSMLPDPDTYDKGFIHCDVLVIGSGPAGLSAALAAGRAGARVVLAEEDFRIGGRLNSDNIEINSVPGTEWAEEQLLELKSLPDVRVMTRTTVFGAYDHGIHGALERRTDHLSGSSNQPRQILWRIYAKQTILCAGATERPIAFCGNDRPGIMLSGAVRSYLNRFGVAAGRQVAVLANNSDSLKTALQLAAQGIETTLIDPVGISEGKGLPDGIRRIDARIIGTGGRKQLSSIQLSDGSRLKVDCLAISGGWNPNLHLSCHQRGRPVWNSSIHAFVPSGDLPKGMRVAGAANGTFGTADCLAEGWDAGSEAARSTGHTPPSAVPLQSPDELYEIAPFWHCKEGRGPGLGRFPEQT